MDNSYNIRVPKKWAHIAMIVAATALIVAPLTAVAGHVFDDVPNSHTFHADIAWLADAGVTKGCNPPTNDEFCPDDNVTRGQMAAFQRRFAQYLGAEDGTPAEADNANTLDGKDSSDFLESGTIVTATGGSAWLPESLPPSTTDRGTSGTWFSGDGSVVISLTAPTQIGPAVYGLEAFDLCFFVLNGGFVDRVTVFRTDDGSLSTTALLSDQTDHTSDGCVTYSVNRSVGAGAGISVGLSGGGMVRLEGVKATWSLSANTT